MFKKLPNDVVNTNYILFFGVLGRANDCGASLHPGIPAELVHHSVVVCQHLALVHYWNKRIVS